MKTRFLPPSAAGRIQYCREGLSRQHLPSGKGRPRRPIPRRTSCPCRPRQPALPGCSGFRPPVLQSPDRPARRRRRQYSGCGPVRGVPPKPLSEGTPPRRRRTRYSVPHSRAVPAFPLGFPDYDTRRTAEGSPQKHRRPDTLPVMNAVPLDVEYGQAIPPASPAAQPRKDSQFFSYL